MIAFARPVSDMNQCTLCGESKPLDAFYSKKGRPGVGSQCRVCVRARVVAWQEANPEKKVANHLKWRKANPEKLAAQAAKWKRANPERVKANNRAWQLTNPDRVKANGDSWQLANKARKQATNAAWKKANAERVKAEASAYQKANRGMCNAKLARYRAAKIMATPAWANDFFIAEAYDLAKRREEVCGGKWHVDHHVPLNSKLVCGLHCEANLRVIPGVENISKGNRYWPDMP